MKYEPLIKIIQEKVNLQIEEEILKAVNRCEIKVDKDELIKALKYDRHQYQEGYKDGIREFAEYLKEHSCSYDLDNYHSFSGIDIECLDDFAEAMQADVPDTNVGEWIPTGDFEEWYAKEFKCSVCGGLMLGESEFCPDCGAKMAEAKGE